MPEMRGTQDLLRMKLHIKNAKNAEDWSAGALVFDESGRDVSSTIPIAAVSRLHRSWRNHRPYKIWRYLLNENGLPYLIGDRIAKEPANVTVESVSVRT